MKDCGMAIITDEMKKKAIGLEAGATIEIEKGLIRKYCEAVGDDNVLWTDSDAARRGPNGTMVAPPGLFHSVFMVGPRPDLPFPLPVSRVLDGGGEWEYFAPSRPGDTLKVVSRIADLYERESGGGFMVFVVYETTWKNQGGELVARARGTRIIR